MSHEDKSTSTDDLNGSASNCVNCSGEHQCRPNSDHPPTYSDALLKQDDWQALRDRQDKRFAEVVKTCNEKIKALIDPALTRDVAGIQSK